MARPFFLIRNKNRRCPTPFIVGVGRSGTTLLRLMLDAHPDLAVPPETGFIPKVCALKTRGEDLRRAFLEAVSGFHTWPDFGLSEKDFGAALAGLNGFTPAAGTRLFYRLYAARFAKTRWGDKTPSYCASISQIRRFLPEARFIHVIRDGRDVALSMRDMLWAPGKDMKTLADHWRDTILEARRQGGRRRDYLEIRYERLVRDPRSVLEEI